MTLGVGLYNLICQNCWNSFETFLCYKHCFGIYHGVMLQHNVAWWIPHFQIDSCHLRNINTHKNTTFNNIHSICQWRRVYRYNITTWIHTSFMYLSWQYFQIVKNTTARYLWRIVLYYRFLYRDKLIIPQQTILPQSRDLYSPTSMNLVWHVIRKQSTITVQLLL